MVFGLRKKKKKDELKDIKEAVSEHPMLERPVTMPVPEPLTAQPLPPELESMAKEMELAPPPTKTNFAPLFVKIDRYREVLENIEKLKSLLMNMEAILGMRSEIDKARADADVLLEKTSQQLGSALAELDRELIRPQEARPFIKPPETGLKTYVNDLEDEVRKLKGHLNRFK